jgi:hypothetical protein
MNSPPLHAFSPRESTAPFDGLGRADVSILSTWQGQDLTLQGNRHS